MERHSVPDRRNFLCKSGLAVSAALIGSTSSFLFAQEEDKQKCSEILPPEDLMREHGVLNRILLIYEESVRRIDVSSDLPIESIAQASRIVRSFVENYHEKLEEDFLFPRFRKAGRLVDLVDVLLQQHNAGRKLTDSIMKLATAKGLKNTEDRRKLSESMRQFINMYRPHAAREDTVLFPALRGIVTSRQLNALGEQFEKKEEDLFGYTGFFKIVDQVEQIEKKLGIQELSRFTPSPA